MTHVHEAAQRSNTKLIFLKKVLIFVQINKKGNISCLVGPFIRKGPIKQTHNQTHKGFQSNTQIIKCLTLGLLYTISRLLSKLTLIIALH